MIEKTLAKTVAAQPSAPKTVESDASSGGLLESLGDLLTALMDVFISLVDLVLPWAPLIAWIAFWLFAVNWVKLRAAMLQGAWVGVVLIGLVMVLVWGSIAPPDGGTHDMLGLSLSNYVGKTVYVTTLFCIMFLCGSVQLSGFCASCCQFDDEEEPADDHAHAAH